MLTCLHQAVLDLTETAAGVSVCPPSPNFFVLYEVHVYHRKTDDYSSPQNFLFKSLKLVSVYRTFFGVELFNIYGFLFKLE
jgi:hypothetical protein